MQFDLGKATFIKRKITDTFDFYFDQQCAIKQLQPAERNTVLCAFKVNWIKHLVMKENPVIAGVRNSYDRAECNKIEAINI